jgi:transcriptional regulator with XRE-family HTH domain
MEEKGILAMDKQQLTEIGGRLRQKRTELGLTRESFAELANIGAGYYGQLEVGTSQMSIDTLIKISRAMKLPMEYILFGTGYERGDASAVVELLNGCNERELKLAEQVLKLFIMKGE